MKTPKRLTQKQKDEHLTARLPGILRYHQLMLGDAVRNRLLHSAIEKHVSSKTSFLDVGAGTGVWAILAAKLGAKRVVAIEIEECLIPIIHRHAKENGVANNIEIIQGNSNDAKIRGKFDVIVSELFGGEALGEETIKSFVSVRDRFLAPNGVLIPQELSMNAVPVRIKSSLNLPADLPLSCDYLRSARLNYPYVLSFAERKDLEIYGVRQKLVEVDFRNVVSAPSLLNLSAEWEIERLSEVNGFMINNTHKFDDGIEMNSFESQSWGTPIYEFQPFETTSGKLKLDISFSGPTTIWTVSGGFPAKTLTYSAAFALARQKMAQQTAIYKTCRPGKRK